MIIFDKKEQTVNQSQNDHSNTITYQKNDAIKSDEFLMNAALQVKY